jgi:acyl-homoserine-lactone acylase
MPLTHRPGGFPAATVPFDPADPVHTPRGLDLSPESAKVLRTALADAVQVLGKRGVALDAPWGSLQHAVRNDERIPIHGGSGQLGLMNMQESPWQDGVGYVPVHGSSYMQVVTFDANGPIADAVLSYSQSTDPASPHYADQTHLYSAKRWSRLPFTPAQIRAEQVSVKVLREPLH